MFKRTDDNRQLDIFSTPETYLCSRTSKHYLDPQAWHNVFFHKVTSRIEKCIFQVLFPKGKKAGRSVSSIRILVAMSILKEGFGSSDEELFEKCEFDILPRRALGLVLLDDVLPSLDTYYLLRRRICDYYVATGTDLLQLCFEQVTGAQVKELKISGKCVQMDNKLIGSNIASCSRHELIHKPLKLYLNSVGIDSLPEDIQGIAESWFSEDSSKTIYRSDHDTLHNRLQAIGEYIYAILTSVVPSHGRYDLLERLFNEQYSVTEDRVQLRDKNGHKTQGYVTNITETVEDGKPSIITSVQVETATHGDCTFLLMPFPTASASRKKVSRKYLPTAPTRARTTATWPLRKVSGSRQVRCKADAALY